MIEKLTEILKASETEGWEIRDTKTNGWEFYFIRHALDQNRVKNVEHVEVTVYQKIGLNEIGSASCEIEQGSSEVEMKKAVEDLCFRASLVANKYYYLNQPREALPMEGTVIDLKQISKDFMDVMNDIPETETEDINSYEIFVSEVESRLLTSTGIDITEKYPYSFLEVVVNARKQKQEIEIYRSYTGGTCDKQNLKEDIIRALRFGRDRLKTIPTPKLEKAAVLFSTGDAVSIYSYFLDRLDASYIYRGMSDWHLMVPIDRNAKGDKVTIEAKRWLPNSSCNRAYDREGSPINDTYLMKANVPCAYAGATSFSQYLGLSNTFIVSNFEVSGGTMTEAALRRGNYLEIVSFSDFQVDAITGDIFGEIRLGYYHSAGKIIPVSGGSISGSMQELIQTMYMSKRQVQYDNAKIPALTRLENVTIAGE